jgi:hypothetical protein
MRQLQRVFLIGFLGLHCLALSACRQPNPAFLKTEPVNRDKAQFFTVVGEPFEIVLPALASNSLKWAIQSQDTAMLEFVQERKARSEYPEGAAPAGYFPNTVFQFKPLQAGETELVFYQVGQTSEPPAADQLRHFRVLISKSSQ